MGAPAGAGAPKRPIKQGFLGCRSPEIRLGRITLRVQRDGRNVTVEVRADGDGVVSHAGSALVALIADKRVSGRLGGDVRRLAAA